MLGSVCPASVHCGHRTARLTELYKSRSVAALHWQVQGRSTACISVVPGPAVWYTALPLVVRAPEASSELPHSPRRLHSECNTAAVGETASRVDAMPWPDPASCAPGAGQVDDSASVRIMVHARPAADFELGGTVATRIASAARLQQQRDAQPEEQQPGWDSAHDGSETSQRSARPSSAACTSKWGCRSSCRTVKCAPLPHGCTSALRK